MSASTIAGQVLAAGRRMAECVADAKRDRLIAAVAADLPGVIATAAPDAVILAAPGLRARLVGTRATPRDIRLVAFLEANR